MEMLDRTTKRLRSKKLKSWHWLFIKGHQAIDLHSLHSLGASRKSKTEKAPDFKSEGQIELDLSVSFERVP